MITQLASFPNEPGTYTLTAEFVSSKGKKIRLPQGPASDNQVSFHVVRENRKGLPPGIDITKVAPAKSVSA